MGTVHLWIERERAVDGGDRIRVPPRRERNERLAPWDTRVERIERRRPVECRRRRRRLAHPRLEPGIADQQVGIPRAGPIGAVIGGGSPAKIEAVVQYEAQRRLNLGERRGKRHRAFGRDNGRVGRGVQSRAVEILVADGQQRAGARGISRSKFGIGSDRRVEEAERGAVRRLVARLIVLLPPAQIGVERSRIVGSAPAMDRWRQEESHLERIGDVARNLILNGEGVAGIPVEPLRPAFESGRRLDQVCTDPHRATVALDAAFEDVGDAELRRDRARVERAPLERQRRRSRRNLDLAEAGERRAQLFGEPFRQIIVARFTRQVGERQDRNARRRHNPGASRDRASGDRRGVLMGEPPAPDSQCSDGGSRERQRRHAPPGR